MIIGTNQLPRFTYRFTIYQRFEQQIYIIIKIKIIIPIVIGATGAILKSFKYDLDKIPCKISRLEMQKTASRETMRIVRRFTQIER